MTDLTPAERKAFVEARYLEFINSPEQVEKRRIAELAKARKMLDALAVMQHDINVLQDRLTELEPVLVRFVAAHDAAE